MRLRVPIMSGPSLLPQNSRLAECGSQIELMNRQIAHLHVLIADHKRIDSVGLPPEDMARITELISPAEWRAAQDRWIEAELAEMEQSHAAFFAARWQSCLNEIAGRDARCQQLETELAQRDAAAELDQAVIRNLQRQINAFTASRSWRIALCFQKLRQLLVPVGSRRHRAVKWLRGFAGERPQSPAPTMVTVPLISACPAPDKPTSSPIAEPAFPPRDREYERWIAEHEPDAAQLDDQRRAAKRFASRPLISILTPVFNTPSEILQATIQSLQDQTYDRWELCLVDGSSTATHVRPELLAAAEADPRIRVTLLQKNAGIAANTNVALGMARGEFVGLLDHDDTLAPFALFEIVSRFNAEPDLDFLYSDKDLISEDGTRRFWPLFKPDWSPDMMLSANYLTHFNVIRTDLARSVGGFRPEVDGAQDWDFFLRVTEQTTHIAHVPHVLYHWRYWNNSVASGLQAKPYVLEAQKRTLAEHFRRTGEQGRVTFEPDTNLHLRRATAPALALSIIVTSRGSGRLPALVESLHALAVGAPVEVLIVRDGPEGGASVAESLRLQQTINTRIVPVLPSETRGAVWNRAARMARGDALLFLDEAAEPLSPQAVGELLLWVERPEIGVVGGKLLRASGTIDRGPLVVGMGGLAGALFAGWPERTSRLFGSCEWYRNCLAVSGVCLMIRRDVLDAVGGFDDAYHRGGCDVDLCLRVHSLGYRNVYNPFARFRAHDELPVLLALDGDDDERLREQCRPFLEAGDPYFNVNLSLAAGDVSFREADEPSADDPRERNAFVGPRPFEILRSAA